MTSWRWFSSYAVPSPTNCYARSLPIWILGVLFNFTRSLFPIRLFIFYRWLTLGDCFFFRDLSAMLRSRESLSLSATKGKNPPSSMLLGDGYGEKRLLPWSSSLLKRGFKLFPNGLGVVDCVLIILKSGSAGGSFSKYLLGFYFSPGQLCILKLESSRFNWKSRFIDGFTESISIVANDYLARMGPGLPKNLSGSVFGMSNLSTWDWPLRPNDLANESSSSLPPFVPSFLLDFIVDLITFLFDYYNG